MDTKKYTWFKPRRGGRHTLIFVLGFLFFPVFGIVMMISSSEPGTLIGGIVMILGGGGAVVYILLRSMASGFSYGTGSSDILLKRGRAVRHIPFTEIAATAVLDGGELSAFLGALSRPVAEAQMQMNLRRWWENSKVYGEITRWISVAITETETRSGGPLSISAYTINLEGPVVFLLLKNGEVLLVSPESPGEFAEGLYRAGVNEVEPGECALSIPSPVLKGGDKKAASQGRRMRIFSLVSFFIIAAAVLTWFFTAGPGIVKEAQQPDTGNADIAHVEERIDAAGYWENDSLFILVLRADIIAPVEDIKPGQRAAPEIDRFAAEAIDTEYQSRSGKSESRLDEIDSYIQFNAVIRFQKNMFNEAGEEFYVYNVEADELKPAVEEFYSGF